MTIGFSSALEFPDKIVDLLNEKKEEYIVLQLVKSGGVAGPLPAKIPRVPVDPEEAELNIDTNTGEPFPIEQ